MTGCRFIHETPNFIYTTPSLRLQIIHGLPLLFFKTQLYCYINPFWTFAAGARFMRSRRRMGPKHYDYLHENTPSATSKILWYIHLSTGLKTRIQNSKDPRPSVHDKKYLKGFEMLCGREMEEISWTDRVRNKVQNYTESKGGEERPTYRTTKEDQLV
jgi:hypothetical protein